MELCGLASFGEGCMGDCELKIQSRGVDCCKVNSPWDVERTNGLGFENNCAGEAKSDSSSSYIDLAVDVVVHMTVRSSGPSVAHFHFQLLRLPEIACVCIRVLVHSCVLDSQSWVVAWSSELVPPQQHVSAAAGWAVCTRDRDHRPPLPLSGASS